MSSELLVTHQRGVSAVSINRPPLNTLTLGLLNGLLQVLDELDVRDATRCVTLGGTGTRAFSAGADLAQETRGSEDSARALRDAGRRLVERIETFPKPVVAAIRGWCIGGGFALAQACDIRLAAESARFRTGDAYIGIVPSWGMSLVRLAHYIGRNRALDLLMLGEDVDAVRAHHLGLITRVIPDEQFQSEVTRIADRLASGAPLVFRAIKEATRSQYTESPAAARHLETVWSEATRDSHDSAEGVAAFKEKRVPRFEGR